MTPTLRRWFTAYLVAWVLGCLGAATSHLLLHHEEATSSQWTHSPGWQREIGLFNLALGFVLVQVLRGNDDDSRRMMARTGAFLALLLGTNHLAALVSASEGSTRIHWTALGVNVASGIVSTTLLIADRRGRQQFDGRRG